MKIRIKETAMNERSRQMDLALIAFLAVLSVHGTYCGAQRAEPQAIHHHYTLIDL